MGKKSWKCVKDMIELLKSWENIVYVYLLKIYRQTDKWKCLKRGWGLIEKRDSMGRKGIRQYSDSLSNTITKYHVHICIKLLNHKRKPFFKNLLMKMSCTWKPFGNGLAVFQSRCTLGTPRWLLDSLNQNLTSEFYSLTLYEREKWCGVSFCMYVSFIGC